MSTIPGIGIAFKKARTSRGYTDPNLDQLMTWLGGLKLPRRLASSLPGVVRESWRAYEATWGAVTRADPVGFPATPDERLLANMIAVRFFTFPKQFLKWWVGVVVRESRWRKADPKKWAVWSPTNPLFVEEGEKVAEQYCGDPTRFTAMMKGLLK